MSLSVHEIEAEILTLPEQEQQKIIDFVESLRIKLVNRQAKRFLDIQKNQTNQQTEGERVLAILQKNGYLGSMPDVADLSENYKDYLDWSDKI